MYHSLLNIIINNNLDIFDVVLEGMILGLHWNGWNEAFQLYTSWFATLGMKIWGVL